jgi:cysteine synthase
MVKRISSSVLDAIGNTPLVRLNRVVPEKCADVFIKLEYYSPTGSYKDRMALAMVEEAEKRADLKAGMTVVEYTGGSTGSSLALVCSLKGYKFRVVSSDAFAKEKIQTMKVFGADVEIVPSVGGKTTPDLVPRLIQRATEIANSEPSYFTDQFKNRDSMAGYENIANEILEQLNSIQAFCGSVGTAAMLMGVSRALHRANPIPCVIALEPSTSPAISKGTSGTHHVDGVAAGFVPPLLDKNLYDEARTVDEDEARKMAWRLAKEEGIFAGTSTGMNVVGAIEVARELGPGNIVATVAVDSGLKYLTGNLYREMET